MLWKYEASNIAFVASEDLLADVMKVMPHVRRSVSVNIMHVLVLGPTDRPLYDGATHLREKVPWAWVEINKFQRPLSGTGGGFTCMRGTYILRLLSQRQVRRLSRLSSHAPF